MEEKKLLRKRSKAEKDKNDTLLVSVCTDLANLYVEEGRFDFAIDEYTKIAKIYKKQDKVIEYAIANRGIGEAYLGLRNFEKSLHHQKIYLDIAKNLGNKLEEQRALATIGHIYLSKHLDFPDEDDKSSLHNAAKFFEKSLNVCQRLTGEATKLEIADMSARLYANLGVVEDCLGNFQKSSELINKSINLCKKFDIYEQLHRGYMSLASLSEKKGDCRTALQQYNLAIETAKKLHTKPFFMAVALLEKSQTLVKLGDFKGAKASLLKAYRLKISNKKERDTIETNLRVVTAMCIAEDKIVAASETDYSTLKSCYEKMGDGACELKNYDKALDYYKKMLEAATKADASNSELATCYYSLAETYKDNAQYDEAVAYFEKELDLCRALKDKLNTLSKIADTKETANCALSDLRGIYERAIKLCQEENNRHEEGRMLKRFILYLRRQNRHSEAARLQEDFEKLNFESSDSESENSESQAGSHIGRDINIDEITDVSDDSDCDQTSKRRRPKNFTVKRNVKGETQLHTACINGKLNVVKHLLEQGHPVNVRDNSGWLPLHEASICGHLEIVQLLLEKGAAINDRGGTHCGGMTPLHDAASNGHLHVVKLLLDKGANAVAITDDGDSVLKFLKHWRATEKLDDASEVFYLSIVDQLSVALEKAGHVEHNTTCNVESVYVQETGDRRNLRRSRTTGLEDLDSENYSSAAADDYRNTIESLRKRNSPKKTPLKSQNSSPRPALVSASETVDDWLDDDLPNKTKKRKTNSPIKTSTRKSVSSVIDITDTSSMDLEDDVLNAIFDEENSNDTNYCDFDVPSTSTAPISQGFKRKRKHQAKLTSFGHTRILVEADSTSSPNFPRQTSFGSPVKISNRAETPSVVHVEPTLGVDVRINEKLYRVPVLLSQVNTHSIKWLAEEAAARYARKEYVKPVLELETKNGAILAEDDLINILFPMGATQAESVEARIVKWNVPPLTERFREACQDMGVDPSSKICKALEELSISLDMSYRGLKGSSLAPLCKALNRQTNLIELDLSGNFLTSECIKLLSTSLSTLQNLNKLNLSCTHLLSEHLKTFVDSLKIENSLKLEDLDLSGNFLGDDCFENLLTLTNLFKLKKLNMSMNNLSSKLFDQNKNMILSLMYVEDLNISDNSFDNEGTLKILSGLSKATIKKLDVSRNKLSGNFLPKLMEMWSQTGREPMPLEVFELSRCNVQDSDLFDLLALTDCLKKLDLSYNNDLTSISLRRVFQSNSLKEINLIGCTNIFKYFIDFSRYVEMPVNGEQRDKSLKLSVDHEENKTECDYLIGMWKEWFGDRVKIEKMTKFLYLLTSSEL